MPRAEVLLGVLCSLGSIAAGAEDGSLPSFNLFQSPPAESQTLWKWQAPTATLSSILLLNGTLYALSATAGVWRISEKGGVLWHKPISGARWAGTFLDQLWLQEGNDTLVAIDQQYAYVHWQHRFSAALATLPCAFNQNLWVVDQDRQLWQIHSATGQRFLWMNLGGAEQPMALGASEERRLLLAADPWLAIDTIHKASERLPALPRPHRRDPQWTARLDGLYFLDADRRLNCIYDAARVNIYKPADVERYWLVDPYIVLYQDKTQTLQVLKDGQTMFTQPGLESCPQGVGNLDDHILIFLPKGEVRGIDSRSWQDAFQFNLESPPAERQPVLMHGDTAYYVNYEGTLIAAVILIDLF